MLYNLVNRKKINITSCNGQSNKANFSHIGFDTKENVFAIKGQLSHKMGIYKYLRYRQCIIYM